MIRLRAIKHIYNTNLIGVRKNTIISRQLQLCKVCFCDNVDNAPSLGDHLPSHMRNFLTEVKTDELKEKAADYGNWEKWELIRKIEKLEKQIETQQNIINKYNELDDLMESHGDHKQDKALRRCKLRRIAIKLMYLGFQYQGLVFNKNVIDKTILSELRKALLKCNLIQSWDQADVIICGRTDKEVSSFGQVLTLSVRSNKLAGEGIFTPDCYEEPQSMKTSIPEFNYPLLINKKLPLEVRVLAWAPVDLEFHPRFNCKRRTYKYYFLKEDLNIENMQKALNLMIGEHDFRNLCKQNLGSGIVYYVRQIFAGTITSMPSPNDNLMVLKIEGKGFLWHQIRYIVSILTLVGRGKENPQIVSSLLDVDNCPRKPMYDPAKAYPLVFYDCEFDRDIPWEYSKTNLMRISSHYRVLSTKATIQSAMIDDMLHDIDQLLPPEKDTIFPRRRPYKQLLERVMSDTFEETIEKIRLKKEAYKSLVGE